MCRKKRTSNPAGVNEVWGQLVSGPAKRETMGVANLGAEADV